MRNVSLKQKDFDSYCMKFIREAEKKGACRFKPTKNFLSVFARINELVVNKFPHLDFTADNGEIIITKLTTVPPPPQKTKGKSPLLPNAIYEPLRK